MVWTQAWADHHQSGADTKYLLIQTQSVLFLYDFPDVSFIAQARWAVAGRRCSRPWINGMKGPLWAVILLPLVWDASSLPAKQMPVIYSVKNPQEKGDIVKTLLKSDVFNGIKRNKKYTSEIFSHYNHFPLMQPFKPSSCQHLHNCLFLFQHIKHYSSMFYKVTARSIPARGCAPISTSSFFVSKI